MLSSTFKMLHYLVDCVRRFRWSFFYSIKFLHHIYKFFAYIGKFFSYFIFFINLYMFDNSFEDFLAFNPFWISFIKFLLQVIKYLYFFEDLIFKFSLVINSFILSGFRFNCRVFICYRLVLFFRFSTNNAYQLFRHIYDTFNLVCRCDSSKFVIFFFENFVSIIFLLMNYPSILSRMNSTTVFELYRRRTIAQWTHHITCNIISKCSINPIRIPDLNCCGSCTRSRFINFSAVIELNHKSNVTCPYKTGTIIIFCRPKWKFRLFHQFLQGRCYPISPFINDFYIVDHTILKTGFITLIFFGFKKGRWKTRGLLNLFNCFWINYCFYWTILFNLYFKSRFFSKIRYRFPFNSCSWLAGTCM